jgi:multiple sugar transport system substrate-binding protein
MYAITFPLYYRKDLFQEAGLAVPKTFEEMEAAAKKLTDKSKSQFGMLLRGQAAPAVGVWPAFLYNFGGNWFTPDGKPAINTPESVESLMFYGRLAREYGPPGALNLNWPQLSDMFAQGRGAMFCDSSSLVVRWEDPQKSKVVDKVGYALLPGGKGGQQPALNTPLWAIYAKSRKKEAAWTFIQWAAGKEMCARMQRAGITQPRRSAWQDVQFQKDFGARHPDFTDTLLQSYTRGKAFLYPPFVNVALARDTYGEVIAISIRGGDVKAAADAAQAKLLEQQRKEAAG